MKLHLLQHILPRRAPYRRPEVLAEEGRIGKVQQVTDLLDGIGLAFQQGFGFQDDVLWTACDKYLGVMHIRAA